MDGSKYIEVMEVIRYKEDKSCEFRNMENCKNGHWQKNQFNIKRIEDMTVNYVEEDPQIVNNITT